MAVDLKIRFIMTRYLLLIFVILFSFISYADSNKPLIYNQEALTEQLKGEDKEAVVKILGEPAVKKPSEESEKSLEYWWYSLPEAGIFVYFKDGMVYNISVLTEDKRSKEL